MAAGETSAPAVGATLRGMIRFRILTAARLANHCSQGIMAGLVLPWSAELTLGAGSMRPAPWLREIPGFGPMLDVVAVRWVGDGREKRVDICYPVAADRDPAEPRRVMSTKTGEIGFQYAWVPAAIPPPLDLYRWSEPDEAERLDSVVVGMPEGPTQRAAERQGRGVIM